MPTPPFVLYVTLGLLAFLSSKYGPSRAKVVDMKGIVLKGWCAAQWWDTYLAWDTLSSVLACVKKEEGGLER